LFGLFERPYNSITIRPESSQKVVITWQQRETLISFGYRARSFISKCVCGALFSFEEYINKFKTHQRAAATAVAQIPRSIMRLFELHTRIWNADTNLLFISSDQAAIIHFHLWKIARVKRSAATYEFILPPTVFWLSTLKARGYRNFLLKSSHSFPGPSSCAAIHSVYADAVMHGVLLNLFQFVFVKEL
jgi:hypothetical protein